MVYQGTVYGVMGVEISENYLAEMLPVRELNSQNQGSYMLAGLAEDGSLDPMVVTGAAVLTMERLETETTRYNSLYRLSVRGREAYAGVSRLHLYNTNTPFSDEVWVVAGVEGERELFGIGNKIVWNLLIAILVGLVFGMVSIYIMVSHLTKPIRGLVKCIRNSGGKRLTGYQMSDIAEVDELFDVVQELMVRQQEAEYSLMEEKEREVTEMKELMIQRQDKMELVLKQMAKVLAANTNYATMITSPQYHRTKLKFIQLSVISEDQLLAVVVAEGNVVKNKVIPISHGLDNETILKLNILLNTSLNGLTMEEINLSTIAKLKEQAGIHSEVINSVLDAVAEAIQMDDDLEVYTSGTTNIFKYPELADSTKASALISAFEDKQQLASLMEDMKDGEDTGIQVYIGNETPGQTMKDCSVVTTTYELGEGMRGTIGIVGPKRMDYEKVVDNLKTLTNQLDLIFNKNKEGR